MRDIPNYEGLYAVTEDGNVWSHTSKKFIKPFYWQGRKQYQLSKNGKRYTTLAARLVALAYIPNPENKPEVNHIDGNKANDHVSNLEWMTRLENERHAYEVGIKNQWGINNHQAILNPCKVVGIIQSVKSGKTQTQTAKDYGISFQHVSDIMRGKRWRNLTQLQ